MSDPGIILRPDLLSSLEGAISDGEWPAIVAPAGSGRTTLASQLREAVRRSHKRWHVHLIAFSPAATLDAAWSQVLSKWGMNAKETQKWSHKPIADGLQRFFETDRDDVCLILDDLHQLPTQVLRLLAAELRRFFDRRNERGSFRRFHCVVIGGLELHYLAVGANSPLSNVLSPFHVPDLTAAEAARCLALATSVAELEGAARDVLFRETAGHPSLVAAIAKRIKGLNQAPTTDNVEAAVQWWIEQCSMVARGAPDHCFEGILSFLQAHGQCYATVLKLFCEDEALPSSVLDEEMLLSGAVTVAEGKFRFRGRMLEKALRNYLDPLRRADYWCLHGNWDEAKRLYRSVSTTGIRDRRWMLKGLSDPGILDLYLGVTGMALELSEVRQAEVFIAEVARHLLGADRSVLWRFDPDKDTSVVAAHYPEQLEPEDGKLLAGVASQSARHHILTTLEHNLGIVQGIGAPVGTPRWALQLDFAEGIPSGSVVHTNLKHLEPSFFMVLERARQRELNESRLRAQRKLIHGINLRLQRSTKLNEVFDEIVNGIQEDLRYECAQLSLVFPEENLIRAVATNGLFDGIKDMTVRDLNGPDLLAQVYRSKQPCNVTDCSNPEFHCDPETIRITGFKSNAVLPLMDGERVVGVLQVGDSFKTFAFRDLDPELLQPLADCAAVAIARAREREAFELGFSAAGDAVAIVDAAGKLLSCNAGYRKLFAVDSGAATPLTSLSDGGGEPLVKVAFNENQPILTVRECEGRNCEVTAASVKDAFGRFAGGVEVVRTAGPMQGLTEALGKVLQLSDVAAFEEAIVDRVGDHLGFPRVRFYKYDAQQDSFISRSSRGLDAGRAGDFSEGKIILRRSDGEPAANFAACVIGQPLIILRKFSTNENPPEDKVTRDSRGRRVFVMRPGDERFKDELEKSDVPEWLDVPLISGGKLLGKLTVDPKGVKRVLSLADMELLGLFGHWAAEAYGKVLALEEARHRAELVQGVGLLGKDKGVESLAWDFLLNITVEGGPGFNRAVLFLKQPQTGNMTGFYCHGAATGLEWEQILGSARVRGSRHRFLDEARRAEVDGRALDPLREARLMALREIHLMREEQTNPFVQAWLEGHSVVVEGADRSLAWLYDRLTWQPTDRALICPLIHDQECEGILYVDRAFVPARSQSAFETDRALVESLCYHFAAIAQPLRLGRQLHEQVLGVSHKLISPMSSVCELAQAMTEAKTDEERRTFIEHIIAESKRAAHTARTLLLAAAGGPVRPVFRPFDLVSLLLERLSPYLVLLRADGLEPRVWLPERPVDIEGDSSLLGDVFAELADNARTAVLAGDERPAFGRFHVCCRASPRSGCCRVMLTNSGAPVPPDLRQRLFERYVSGTASTGLGLPLVRTVVQAHGGSISFTTTRRKWSRFVVTLPLKQR